MVRNQGRTGVAAAVLVACLSVSTAAWAAPQPVVDRTRLDALIAQFEASDSEADPAGYRSLADRTLAEARRLYPATHPEVAARELYVANALAAAGKMDEALVILNRAEPILAKAPAYRPNWRNALSTRAYVLNFKGDHAASLAINELLVSDYGTNPAGISVKDHATNLSNLAASYLEHGRLDDALKRNAEAIELGLTLKPVPGDVAIWNANRVAYLYSAGRTEEAIAAAQTAIARVGAAIGADHPMMSNLYANLGAISLRVNRPHDAMPMIRRAYELIEKAGGGPNQNSAAMRVQFAQALIRAGQYEDAVAFLAAATPVIDAQIGAESDRALVARDTLLTAYLNTGRSVEAQALARELLRIRDAKLPEGHRDRANARDNLARAAFANSDWAVANDAATQAVDLRVSRLPPDHPDLLLARTFLLRVEDGGNLKSDSEIIGKARELFAALTQNANLARGSAQAERQRPAYGWLAEIFAHRNAVEDAFTAQQWTARSQIEESLAIAASERNAAANAALGAKIADRRKLLAERRGLDAKVDANLARPDAGFNLASIMADREQNRQAIAAIDAGLTPAERAQLVFTPSRLADLGAGQSGSDMTVMFTDLGGSWIVTAAQNGRTNQYLIAQGKTVNRLVAQVRAGIESGPGVAFDRKVAADLFALLFPAEAGKRAMQSAHLAIIANGSLAALPFGLLVPNIKRGDYLIDRVAVARLVRAPDGTIAKDKPLAAQNALIALGGVEGGRAGSLMAMRSAGTARAIADLPQLPDASRELVALAAAVGSATPKLLIGEQATELGLRAADVPPDAVLAFATHGLLSGELNGLDEPALLLTPSGNDDGLLKPSEIGALHLPARLVILSACNTAAASDADKPQLSGLVQGFFLAGAKQVMASHWPVRDDVARRLSVGTVKAMRSGAQPPDALRQAIRALRSGKDGEAAALHPALWAPFELFSR